MNTAVASTANRPFDIDAVRAGALKELRDSSRPLCTGELATRLKEPPHRILIALEQPLQDGVVERTGCADWSLSL